MGRLHFSSDPKYNAKPEPVSEDQIVVKWADQAFDPEANTLGGHGVVYEAFLDKDGRSPNADDGDASELNSESSSDVTEELEEYARMHRAASERLPAPSSPALSTRSVERALNGFDDFVRIEAPPSDSLATTPVSRSVSAVRPSSPLRQSVTSTSLDDLPDHPPSDTPEVALQRGDEERLFAYYQSYVAAPPERERPTYGARVVPRVEYRSSAARRAPGNPRFPSLAAARAGLEGQRTPLANTLNVGTRQPRPRSASFSEVIASGTRVPERWLASIDGTVISSRVLAQR